VFARDPSAYDLVITDMSMPEMDGLTFTRAVRAVRPDIPVILATGQSASLNTQRDVDLDALMNKPLRPDEFLGTVRWVLDRRQST
jgi:CheY-like chemotaxis protein